MKTIKLYKYILLFFTITFLSSCEDEDTFAPEVIDTIIDGQTASSMSSFITDVLSREADNQGLIDLDATPTQTEINEVVNTIMSQIQNGELTLELTEETPFFGYVISSDESGNFFEELIIQDVNLDPTIGIKIMINENPLYTIYEFGRKIIVNANGLFLGINNGVLSIGGPTEVDGGGEIEVSKINPNILDTVIARTLEIATITPKEVDGFNVNDTIENIFVRLIDMQFPRESVFGENPVTFASEVGNRFQGERALRNCSVNCYVINLSTSSFANFKSVNLPSGQGSVDGIFARDFRNEKYIFKINGISNIIFENGEEGRCDPEIREVLNCNSTIDGNVTIYNEDFELFDSFVNEGWVNVNLCGSTLFEAGEYNGNNFVDVSGFRSAEIDIQTWLVSPSIDLDATTDEKLNLDIQANFDGGVVLSILVSTDFIDDVETATWLDTNTTIPNGPSGGFGNFSAVDPIDISCLEGTINIAFLYEGSDPNATTGYNIDNIVIKGN